MDFDWSEIGKALPTILPIIFVLVVNFLFRKQQAQKKKLTVVRSLLSEINYNQNLIEAYSMRWQARKFKTAIWKRNKDKMDYVAPDLFSTLAGAYEITEEFNQEIDTAKKYQSNSYIASIKMDRLREPLTKSKQGLEEWIQLNKGKEKIFKRSRNLAP